MEEKKENRTQNKSTENKNVKANNSDKTQNNKGQDNNKGHDNNTISQYTGQ